MNSCFMRWGFSFAILLAIIPPQAIAKATRPNIILIVTDDQGYGDLECHGNPILKTPNLNLLHDQSARFTDFHVSPTCAPTRSALMTGRHEFKNGVTHTIRERERLTLNAITFPQLLKEAGYATGIFGKWHLGDEDPYQPGQRGFTETFIHGGGGIGQSYPGSCGDAPGNLYFNPVIKHNSKFEATKGYCTDVFFRQAMLWMEEVQNEKPFFCYLATNAPHSPLVVDENFRIPYDNQVDNQTALFYGMIANIDLNIGRMFKYLSTRRLDQNTVLIFMTDNGSAHGSKTFNAGMRAQKGTQYRGGTRVPLFVRWPGQVAPGERSQTVAHIDLFPTVLALAGVTLNSAAAKQVEGRSLLPLLENPKAPWADRFLFTHVGRWEVGQPPVKEGKARVNHQNFHWVCEPQKDKAVWSLYDLKADPAEKVDVSAQHPDRVRQFREAYDAWWNEVTPLLVNEEAHATAPEFNPFQFQYWKQFGGPGPNNVPPGEKKSKRSASN